MRTCQFESALQKIESDLLLLRGVEAVERPRVMLEGDLRDAEVLQDPRVARVGREIDRDLPDALGVDSR
jgi:hypothetical protein